MVKAEGRGPTQRQAVWSSNTRRLAYWKGWLTFWKSRRKTWGLHNPLQKMDNLQKKVSDQFKRTLVQAQVWKSITITNLWQVHSHNISGRLAGLSSAVEMNAKKLAWLGNHGMPYQLVSKKEEKNLHGQGHSQLGSFTYTVLKKIRTTSPVLKRLAGKRRSTLI